MGERTNLRMYWLGKHDVPPLAEEIFPIDTCWERESVFSLRFQPLMGLSQSSRRPYIQKYMGHSFLNDIT